MDERELNVESNQGGKVVFAEDVVATIASLAAGDVEGVHAMSGTAMDGLTEKFGKKSYTKGIRVEVGTQECAVDLSLIIKYGYRIQDVARKVQQEVRDAIETMTGLKVVEVNVAVSSIYFEPVKKDEAPAAPAPEAPAPRVK